MWKKGREKREEKKEMNGSMEMERGMEGRNGWKAMRERKRRIGIRIESLFHFKLVYNVYIYMKNIWVKFGTITHASEIPNVK